MPVESVARVPAGADDVAASTLPMNGLTAQLALDRLALAPGQTLAVTGAAGCFGGYMVQLAKAAGLRVIADASEADEELVAALGADVVVRRGDGVAARIREVCPDGVDGLADGAVQHAALLPAVRDGGVFASVRPFEGETERDITIHTVFVRDYLKEAGQARRPPPARRGGHDHAAGGGVLPDGTGGRGTSPLGGRRGPRPIRHRALTPDRQPARRRERSTPLTTLRSSSPASSRSRLSANSSMSRSA